MVSYALNAKRIVNLALVHQFAKLAILLIIFIITIVSRLVLMGHILHSINAEYAQKAASLARIQLFADLA